MFAYATVAGFHYDVSSIGRTSVPFLTVADHALGRLAILAWIAGIVSVLAALVAGSSSQARMLFDDGRSGLLPAPLGRLREQTNTPVNALIAMASVGLGIIGVWWLTHVISGHTRSLNPVGLYAECSTMGTIVILVLAKTTSSDVVEEADMIATVATERPDLRPVAQAGVRKESRPARIPVLFVLQKQAGGRNCRIPLRAGRGRIRPESAPARRQGALSPPRASASR